MQTNFLHDSIIDKSGTKGSAIRYLKKKGCTDEDINIVAAVFLAADHLSTEDEWKAFRPLWKRYCEEELFSNLTDAKKKQIMTNLFDNYFTNQLKWGYAHSPGEVKSTNGLESGWRWLRKEIQRKLKKNHNAKNEGNFSTVVDVIRKWSSRSTNKAFVGAPVHYFSDWNAIRNMRSDEGSLDAQFRLMVCYDKQTSELVSTFPFDENVETNSKRSLVCYLASSNLVNSLQKQYHDKSVNPMGHSRTSRMDGRTSGKKRTTKWQNDKDERSAIMSGLSAFLASKLVCLNQLSTLSSLTQSLEFHTSTMNKDEHPYALESDDCFSYLRRRCYRLPKNASTTRYSEKIKELRSTLRSVSVSSEQREDIESDIDNLNDRMKHLKYGLSADDYKALGEIGKEANINESFSSLTGVRNFDIDRLQKKNEVDKWGETGDTDTDQCVIKNKENHGYNIADEGMGKAQSLTKIMQKPVNNVSDTCAITSRKMSENRKEPITAKASSSARVVNRQRDNPSLIIINGEALGNFCRATVEWDDIKEGDLQYHNALASVSSRKRVPKVRVNCSCDDFRINGTCDESKFLGLLAGKEYPPASCVKSSDPHTPVTWQEVRTDLINSFKKRCYFFDNEVVNKLDIKPPNVNPWTANEDTVNSKHN